MFSTREKIRESIALRADDDVAGAARVVLSFVLVGVRVFSLEEWRLQNKRKEFNRRLFDFVYYRIREMNSTRVELQIVVVFHQNVFGDG